jgi:hypothetical protein
MLSRNKGKLGFRNFTVLFQKYNPIIYGGLIVSEAETSACAGITATIIQSGSVGTLWSTTRGINCIQLKLCFTKLQSVILLIF